MSDLIAENRKLREQIEELQEEKRQREEVTRAVCASFPRAWRLSNSQRIVLATLLDQPNHLASRDRILTALKKYNCGTKSVDALIFQMRPRLRVHGIEIITVISVGYQLAAESAAVLKYIVNERAAKIV